MTVATTVVASLIPCFFSTFRGNVASFPTVEAPAILSTGLVYGLSGFSFQTLVFAISGDVSSLATVVTSLIATTATRGDRLRFAIVCHAYSEFDTDFIEVDEKL